MSRRTTASAPTISLFPFLAVLLCTMGALLVLLVLFSRSASQAGSRVADAAIEDLELALENARWRRDQLEEVRKKTSDDLSRARMALAGVEENTRALEDEIDRMAREAEALETAAKAADGDELAALEARLTNARESLDKAREDQASRPPAYAVVPYVGKQGTHRRPLYIECSVDGVYLQPEGIRLAPGDFEGPPGPGNPLASALRAAREQLARAVPNPGDVAAQPYPLLLVRPSGVMAYYAAREAIVSWGSEFGYQLIDDDWEIAYPPPDPALAEVERRAIEESRRRLEWLAANHPQKPAKPARQYRAAPTRGGVVENGGPTLMGDQSRYEWTEEQASSAPLGRGPRGGGGFGSAGPGGSGNTTGTGAPGSGLGTGGGGNGMGANGVGSGGSGGAAGDGVGPGRPFMAAAGTEDDPAGDAILGGGGNGASGVGGRGGPGFGPGVPGGTVAGNGAPGNGPAGTPGTGSPEGGGAFGTAGLAGQPVRGGRSGSGSPGGASGEGDPGGSDGASGEVGTRYGGASGSAFAGGSAAAAGGSAGGSAGGGASLGAGNGSTGGAGGDVSLPGMLGVKAGGSADGSGGASGSLASSRGANWASLETRDRPVPLTRPIRVECSLNELRILDDTGRRIEKRVPVDGDTAAAIDPFVGALHSKVRGWGLAGDRMYWRPQLVLTATVDGESRRDDLERLLADSGIDVRPHAPAEDVHPLPPVQRASYERLLK